MRSSVIASRCWRGPRPLLPVRPFACPPSLDPLHTARLDWRTARTALEPAKLVLQRLHLLFQGVKPLKQIEMALLQLSLRQAVQIDGRHDHARLHEPSPPNEKPPHPANARPFAPFTFQSGKLLTSPPFFA